MADDIANLLHNSYGLPKTGKSAPMGVIKKGGVQASQNKGGLGKSSANNDPIQDDAFSGTNGLGNKSTGGGGGYAMGDDPFYPGPVKSSSTYGDNDMFGGLGGTGSGKGYSTMDDPFAAMPGSYSSSPATSSYVDPFGGLGSMNSGPSTGAGGGGTFAGDDLLGGFGAGKARSTETPESQPSQDPFQTVDPDPIFSSASSMPTPSPFFPSDANDPFSIPSPSPPSTTAPPSSSSNGHGGDAFSGLNDFLASAKAVPLSSGSGRQDAKPGASGASTNTSFRRGLEEKDSPLPSPHKHRFFGRKKDDPPTPPPEEPLNKSSSLPHNVPGEDAWLTVEDLYLTLVTMPTSAPPPSRPPPPPGSQRRKPPPPPPYQQAAPTPSSWQQPPKSEPPPSYAYGQQAPQSWPPPGSRRPSQPDTPPSYTPPPAKPTPPEPASGGMDGFDAFGSSRSTESRFNTPHSQTQTPPPEPDKDAEATAAAQAAASSSAQMAEAMERAKEKAARARAAKEREDARRAREEAAERLRQEAKAKTQRPVDTGYVNNNSSNSTATNNNNSSSNFFNTPSRRPDSDSRSRAPQSDFMSDPPRAAGGGFSNLDDLGGVGVRKPAAQEPPKKTTPTPTPSTASTANDWADILGGGGGGGGGAASSDQFQEIEGETAERRELRYQKWQTIQQRAMDALAEKNRRDVQAQTEQNERSRADDLYSHEIKRWAMGKEGNLIALISTLQHVLWPECGWEPMSITDLISPAQVKKAYRKATLCVHPDKVQQKGANVHQKYIAEKVFDLLKEAWNKYNQNTLF